MTYSIIQKSQLEGALRLDAEYYQPEFLSYSKTLLHFPTIKSVVEGIMHPQEIVRIYSDDGKLFLLAQNVKNNFINWSIKARITEKSAAIISKNELHRGDVLVVRTGVNFGDTAFVGELPETIIASADVIVIRPKSVDGAYLSAFLNTKIGSSLLKRLGYGAAQPHITPESIGSIRIPRSKTIENNVVEIINQSLKQERGSQNLYRQAEDLLLEELGLKDFDEGNDLFSVVNLSDIKTNNRMDGDFYLPKYTKLINKLANFKTERLSKLLVRVSTKTKIVPNENYNYIEISDVNVSDGSISSNEMVGKELPASAKTPLSGGELIISKVRPTRGAISIIPNKFSDHYICSGAFSVFKGKEMLSEYLFVVLRSLVGKLQMERPCTGTSYPTITDQDVENILVPILSPAVTGRIVNFVIKSHAARQKSKELLGEAKRKVEEMVEKGVN